MFVEVPKEGVRRRVLCLRFFLTRSMHIPMSANEPSLFARYLTMDTKTRCALCQVLELEGVSEWLFVGEAEAEGERDELLD